MTNLKMVHFKRREKTLMRKRWYRDKDYIQLLTMCFLPVLSVFIFNYIPMFGTIIAFKNYKYDLGIFGSPWIGLNNFKAFVSSNDFPRLVFNTLWCNLLFIVFGIMAAILTAVLLFEVSSRTATKVYQTVMIIPHFVSWVLVSYLVYIFLSPDTGVLNHVLAAMGMETIDWYATPKAWPVILTIVSIWKHFGMDSVIYYAALMGVDQNVIEAAHIDGAGKIKTTWHVVLPTIVPLIVVLTLLKIGNICRADFGLFYNVTRDVGALYESTDVFDTYIFRMVREIGDMGMSSAAGLLQSGVGFILVVFSNWASKRIDPESGLF